MSFLKKHIQPSHGSAVLGAAMLLVLVFVGQNVSNVGDVITQSIESAGSHAQLAQISGAGSGLIGYWTFDEGTGTTAADSAGSSNGTLTNGPTWVAGHVGSGAISLDGVNDYVDLGSSAALEATDSWTLSGWVNLSSLGSYPSILVRGYSTNYGVGYDNGYVSGGAGWWMWFNIGGGLYYRKYITTPTLGTWYHVAAVWDDANHTETLYLNGVSVATIDTGSGIHPDSSPADVASIGFDPCCYDGYLNGKLDDVRVYSRALSASDIAELYAYTGFTPPPPPPPPASCVATSGPYKVKDSVAYNNAVYTAGTTIGVGAIGWRIEKTDQSNISLWSQTSQPSTNADEALDIAVDGTGVYAVGYESVSSGVTRWRIEKRDLTTGALVSAFGTGGVVTSGQGVGPLSFAWGAVINGSSLYVAGQNDSPGNSQWRIEKRDLTTGALVSGFGTGGVVTNNPSSNNEGASAIVSDASGIYIIGSDQISSGDIRWRIEKRDLTTGALVSGFGTGGVVTVNPSSGNDSAFRAAIDASGVYVFGFDNTGWLVEKRNLTTGASIWAQNGPSAAANNIAVDGSGVYLIGMQSSAWYMEKRNLSTGAVLWTKTSNPTASQDEGWAIAMDTGGIYMLGYQNDVTSGNIWRTEKINATTGDTLAVCTSSLIDIGLRVQEAGQASPTAIAVIDPSDTSASSPLRIAKNGIIYQVALVDVSDADATQLLVRLAGGTIKALKKF